MISVETGVRLINYGYGHSNNKSFADFSDEKLAGQGLSRYPSVILDAGNFKVPQSQEFETAMNQVYEEIKAGF